METISTKSPKSALASHAGNAVDASCLHLAELLQWAAARPAISGDILRKAAVLCLDDIGVGIAGMDEPAVVRSIGAYAASSGRAEATVLAPTPVRMDRYSAAAANALSMSWPHLDTGTKGAICHAGSYLLPALMAEAEARKSSVRELLECYALTYEVVVRIAVAFRNPEVMPGALYAAMASGLAVGLLRGYSAAELMNVVTAGATMVYAAPTKLARDGATVRQFWTSAANWTGMRMADWAHIGIGALPHTVFDVLASTLGGTVNIPQMTLGLGQEWILLRGYHKVYAACYYTHGTIEASLALAHSAMPQTRIGEISAIEVETYPVAATFAATHPTTEPGAKYSVPHTAAAAAVLRTGGKRITNTASLQQPEIVRLRSLVRISEYQDPPTPEATRVTWHFADGSSVSATCLDAHGSPASPLTFYEVVEKFEDNGGSKYLEFLALLKKATELDTATLHMTWDQVMDAFSRGNGADVSH